MTTATQSNSLAFTDEGFESFLDARQEPAWLAQTRRDAWQKFNELPWPSGKDEEWMRTDIRLFHLEKFNIPGSSANEDAGSRSSVDPALSQGVDLAGSLTSFNGRPVSSQSIEPELAAKGVIFGNLADLVHEHGDLIQKYLHQCVPHDNDRFSALHNATWTSGLFLYVPRNVRIEKPLHAYSSITDGGTDFGHTLIVLEEGAEATVLTESSNDENGTGLHCGATEIFVGDRANLRYVYLQDWSQKVWHFAHQKAVVGRDGNLQWTAGALGSRLAKVNQHVALRGKRAHCQVNGVMFTENKQHLSYHTLQHHEKPETTSDFLYKSALQDKSRTVWRGMIKVDPPAQQTDGYQRNDNLLLSTKARADSIPGLEIEADDVRCTHGSTSGRVDEELIFYAQCRGFTRKEAIRMIVTGFFQQVFDRITIESVREALGIAIARRVRDYE